MMNFVIITLAVMVGTLLAWGLAFVIAMQKPVIKLYTKKAMEISNSMVEELMDDYEVENFGEEV